ncbi:DUF927 domain-containing protein [Geomonas paludis]|uniref:DUF927 domain-containing protein n=1 Tax=Geomonas paludis TaxID=2740185 RepID=A0A6V8MRB2_9BACT|nr:DUF927 domain-containing protein [Geomonas paludis]GFO62337.1 hypothetical protein GMPD_02560 [Geomonas paludis]
MVPKPKIVVPEGFDLKKEYGVFKIKTLNTSKGIDSTIPELVAGWCYVSDLAQVDSEGTWYRNIVFRDFDGQRKEMLVPQRLLVQKGGALVQMLSDAGLAVVPGKEAALVEYLASFQPSSRIVLTRKTGATSDLRHYVLSPRVVIGPEAKKFRFIPEQNCPAEAAICWKGTPEEYEERVLRPAIGNPLLILALLIALASVLVRILRVDNGGFHLSSFTSRGKTTLLQLAASVFGIGTDPNRARESYIQRWSMTQGGAEGLAAAFSEKLLILDELDSFSGDLGTLLYFFSGGRGKASMTATRNLQMTRSWFVSILSSGEKTLREMIVNAGGKPMAGQFVRFLELPVGDDIFKETNGLSKAAFAENLKASCADCYGLLGPAFIEALFADLAAEEQANFDVETLQRSHEEFVQELILPNMRPEHHRALRRLGAAWLAGELAIYFGLVPFSQDDVREAVFFARNLWLREADNQAYITQGVTALQAFLRDNIDAFPLTDDEDHSEETCLGFRHPSRDLIILYPSQLQAASGECSPVDVARELRNLSMLVTHEAGRLTIKVPRASSGGKKENLYAIRAAFLTAELGLKRVILDEEVEGDDQPEWDDSFAAVQSQLQQGDHHD